MRIDRIDQLYVKKQKSKQYTAIFTEVGLLVEMELVELQFPNQHLLVQIQQ